MKKLKYAVLGAAVMLSACHYNEVYYEDEAVIIEEPVGGPADNQVVASPIPTEKAEPAAVAASSAEQQTPPTEQPAEVMNPDQPVEKLTYDSAYDRFLDNVVIKARSDNYVTYEYKDVRVDELAPLASRYCQEQGNRTAVLRSVILYKNYARRATFDCLRLQ